MAQAPRPSEGGADFGGVPSAGQQLAAAGAVPGCHVCLSHVRVPQKFCPGHLQVQCTRRKRRAKAQATSETLTTSKGSLQLSSSAGTSRRRSFLVTDTFDLDTSPSHPSVAPFQGEHGRHCRQPHHTSSLHLTSETAAEYSCAGSAVFPEAVLVALRHCWCAELLLFPQPCL